MTDAPEKTPIRTAYARRFAADLEANRKEQANVTEQIAGLQKRLDQLRVDEAWLMQAQGSLPAVVAPSEPKAGPATAAPSWARGEQSETPAPAEAVADGPQTVPQPRRDQPVKAEQPKKAAKKRAVSKGKAPAKRTAAKAPAEGTTAEKAPAEKAAAKEKSGPPLHELVLAILLQTPGEPRVAREVTDQLAQDHPDRATSVQTVRNNLESLVRKYAVEKVHQQGSAMYIANAADKDAEPAAGPAADGEETPEPAAEKVPTSV
ncbi:hypothetical protein [Streptomyces syringium]|uniref:hypothetical protein n=1 Tax=Streptomyces syringium TaxID=76729 RepID=UPI003413C447